MKLDDTQLKSALHGIHAQLTAAEARTVVDVARMAASADGRMDLGEMSAIARLSSVLHAMAGAANASVPSQPLAGDWLADVASKLPGTGARELAYACAMLVMHTDRKVTKEEDALDGRLASTLEVAPDRARELSAQMAALLG